MKHKHLFNMRWQRAFKLRFKLLLEFHLHSCVSSASNRAGASMYSTALLWTLGCAFFLERSAERAGRSEEYDGHGRCLPLVGVKRQGGKKTFKN